MIAVRPSVTCSMLVALAVVLTACAPSEDLVQTPVTSPSPPDASTSPTPHDASATEATRRGSDAEPTDPPEPTDPTEPTDPPEPPDPSSPLAQFDACGALEAPPPEPDGPVSPDTEVAAAQRARAAVALPSDIATVEALLAAPPPDYGYPLGFPHTEAELDAVMARNGDLDQLEDLQTWALQTHPDTWGGLWLDQSRGGVVTVGFTADVEARVAEIADRYGLTVRGVAVEHTEAELDAAQDALTPLRQPAPEESPQDADGTATAFMPTPTGIGFGVQIDVNRLAVEIHTDDPEIPERIADLVDPALVCLNVDETPAQADAGPASWAPSTGADLSPTSTSIALDVVEESCASGQPADGRVVVRDIAYEADAIVVDIGVISVGDATCPSNPVTPFTLDLEEPLGDRELLDGTADPPVPPQLSH